MANSHAKKQRLKRIRKGRLDPTMHRSAFATLDLRTKRTKTKQEKQDQQKYKPFYPKDGQDGLYFSSYSTFSKKLIVRSCFGVSNTCSGVPSSTI